MDVIHTDKKIESLQVLRGIAFLGIFLSHAGIPFSWSNLSVSIFFVLSGFLLAYKYYDWNVKYSVLKRVRFSSRRIRKLYGLHIVTMLLTLVPFVFFGIENTISIIIKTVLNVLLLQTWIPVIAINVSLNGVAWFLSVMAFQYFCFPDIAYWLKGFSSTKKLAAASVIVWVFMLLTALCFVGFYGIDGKFFKYLTKFCPLYRLGDFLIGCIWGRILHMNEKRHGRLNRIKASVCECVLFAAAIGIVIIGKQPHTNVIAKWIWNPTSIYLLFSVMLVAAFFLKGGVITDWLTRRRTLVYLGDISGEMFLIHYVVLFYFQGIQNRLLHDRVQLSVLSKTCTAIIELAVTVGCTWSWKFAVKWLKGRRKQSVSQSVQS